MATTIQIKRSTGSSAPGASDLVEGELAYAEDRSSDGASAILYISSIDSGSSEVIQKIGGKFYTDIIDGATNATRPPSLTLMVPWLVILASAWPGIVKRSRSAMKSLLRTS